MSSAHHVCNLTINNLTNNTFTWANASLNAHTALASGQDWPSTIAPGLSVSVTCSSSSAVRDCGGNFTYGMGTNNNTQLFFYFGNPVVGSNTVSFNAQNCACTSSPTSSGVTNYPMFTSCTIGGSISGEYVTCESIGTKGSTNNCFWNVQTQVLSVTTGNIQLADVQAVFNAIAPSQQQYMYYQCAKPPVSGANYGFSHFKGLGLIGDRMVLTHTNLHPVIGSNTQDGWILYADNPLALTSGAFVPTGPSDTSSFLTATLESQRSGWRHPCSLQVCGTFLAMGIQSSVSAQTSTIQFFDARPALINQSMDLLSISIPRSQSGINGVGLTQATNGDYVVAAIQGSSLDIYLSTGGTSLLDSNISFNMATTFSNFAASGAGLALVTQQNGDIYLFALNGSDNGGNNQLSLYQLTNLWGSSPACNQVGSTLNMPINNTSPAVAALSTSAAALLANAFPLSTTVLEGIVATQGAGCLGSSFRWGKGVNVISPNAIQVYASDRNVIPWSQVLPGAVDYSVLVWSAGVSSSAAADATSTMRESGKS